MSDELTCSESSARGESVEDSPSTAAMEAQAGTSCSRAGSRCHTQPRRGTPGSTRPDQREQTGSGGLRQIGIHLTGLACGACGQHPARPGPTRSRPLPGPWGPALHRAGRSLAGRCPGKGTTRRSWRNRHSCLAVAAQRAAPQLWACWHTRSARMRKQLGGRKWFRRSPAESSARLAVGWWWTADPEWPGSGRRKEPSGRATARPPTRRRPSRLPAVASS